MTDRHASDETDHARPPLPPVGHGYHAQDMQNVARRLAWPDGALEECRTLQSEFPGWDVYYAVRTSLAYGQPGYRARPASDYTKVSLHAPTPDALREHITAYLDGTHQPPG